MGQLGDQSETGAEEARTVEKILQTVGQDLKNLHQGLIVQLSQEVTRLQAEKSRLMSDIEKLQAYHRVLQSRQVETLTQQQTAQQQLWAKQLAQILAVHLQAQITERLNQITVPSQQAISSAENPAALPANGHSDNAHRLLASLDTTFSNTFRTLQRELDSYQSSLSQQINRMHSLEQQGEAILEELISRLREQLQSETVRFPVNSALLIEERGYAPSDARHPLPQSSHYPPAENNFSSLENSYPIPSDSLNPFSDRGYPDLTGESGPTQFHNSQGVSPQAAPIPIEFPAAPLPLPVKPKREINQFQLGLILVLISTVALSIHNVAVQVIGNESTILKPSKRVGLLILKFWATLS